MYPQLRMKDTKRINRFLRTSPYSTATREQYGWALTKYARWLTHHRLSFGKTDPDVFLDFLDSKDWGENTRYQAFCAVKAYLRYQYGDAKMLEGLKIRKPGWKPQRVLNKEQVQRVFEVIGDNSVFGIRNTAMLYLMVDTGLRSAEVCRLNVIDLDFEQNTLLIKIKSNRWHQPIFSQHTANCIDDWLGVRSAYVEDTDALFVGISGNSPGSRMTTGGMRGIFRAIAKKAGLKKGFSPHDLRRTGPTLFIASGGDSRIARAQYRWDSEVQLERYTHALTARGSEGNLPSTWLSDAK